jgi:hypothetical protein
VILYEWPIVDSPSGALADLPNQTGRRLYDRRLHSSIGSRPNCKLSQPASVSVRGCRQDTTKRSLTARCLRLWQLCRSSMQSSARPERRMGRPQKWSWKLRLRSNSVFNLLCPASVRRRGQVPSGAQTPPGSMDWRRYDQATDEARLHPRGAWQVVR